MGGARAPAGNAKRLPVLHTRSGRRHHAQGGAGCSTADAPAFMNNAHPIDEPTVQAIYVTTEQQRRAFRVVDAIDELHSQLGALRALQQLTSKEQRDSPESLGHLRRSDLAMLLSMLSASLEAHCAKAREAAVLCSKGG